MGRRKPLPLFPEWKVTTTRLGDWTILGPDGFPVFRHPDQVVRLHAFYLAGQAPPLRAALMRLLEIVELRMTGYHHYSPELEFAHLSVRLSKPPADIVAQTEASRHQQDIDLEAA